MQQSTHRKFTLCAAVGVLAALTAAGPALATTGPSSQSETVPAHTHTMPAYPHTLPAPSEAMPADMETMPAETEAEQNTPADARKLYKGKVISKIDLNVRARPTRKSKVVDSLKPGQIVYIKCKVNSKDVVDGNPRWYRLADGKWAWAAARYIKNIGPAPHFC